MRAWEVVALEPNRFLGLRGLSDFRGNIIDPTRTATIGVHRRPLGILVGELPAERCRLVVGGYQAMRPRWLERGVNFWVYPPVHWVMQTRQFANLKRNVESSRASAASESASVDGHRARHRGTHEVPSTSE